MVDARKQRPRPEPPGAGRDEPATRTVFSLSEEETLELGRSLARELRGGERLLLEGDLGLGKTVFARGIAAGLGIAPEDVSSPSYTLVQSYSGGRMPMHHVDLYRIEDPEGLAGLGLDEVLGGDAVVVVEWGERLPPFYRRGAITVRFHDVGEGSRRIELAMPRRGAPRRRGDA